MQRLIAERDIEISRMQSVIDARETEKIERDFVKRVEEDGDDEDAEEEKE